MTFEQAVGVVDDDDEFDLRGYFGVLRRRWVAVGLVVVLVVGLALAYSLAQPKLYTAVSEVLIRQSGTESSFGSDSQPRGSQDAARELNNEAGVLESGTTVAAVQKAYDGPLDPAKVSAVIRSDASDVVQVRLTATDPGEAAALVNTYVKTFIDLRRQQRVDELLGAGTEIQARITALDKQISTARAPLDEVEGRLAADPTNEDLQTERDDVAQRIATDLSGPQTQRAFYQQQFEDLQLTAQIAQSGSAHVLTEAVAPGAPVSPKPIRDVLVALALGLVLGTGVAFLVDSLDERIRGNADLARVVGGLPTLALLPHDDDAGPRRVVARDAPRSAAAEAYRSLRTAVKFASLDRPIKVVQVTSSVAGEGKTTTVANLAAAFADDGDRVAIVCCDLRRPTIHERFQHELVPGFTDVLLGEASLGGALRLVDANLRLLPAGTPPPNPSELLSTPQAMAMISAMAEQFDLVLLDTTPVLPVTDALVVSRLVDATLVVVDSHSTKRHALRRSLELLKQVGAPTLGVVLNGVPAGGGGYGYGYGYTYGYDTRAKQQGRRARRGVQPDDSAREPAPTR